MFFLPSYCRVWVHWSRVCFHARCDCSTHNVDGCPLSLSFYLPPPAHAQSSRLSNETILSKVPDSDSYSYLASWAFPPHFHKCTLDKGHFFCTEICALRTRTVPVSCPVLEETLHKYWDCCFCLHWRQGQLSSQHEQCHLKDDSFSGLEYFFFYLLMDCLLQFYFLKLSCLEEILL